MAETAMSGVELDDIQGLLRWGFGRHTEAVFLLLRVKDAGAARQWLRRLEPTSSVRARASLGAVPDTLLQVALTSDGMRALGVRPDIISGFSEEFLEGMTGDANRTRRLGDIGASAHDRWVWGSGDRVPHVAVLLYARPGCLESFQRSIETASARRPEGYRRDCRAL